MSSSFGWGPNLQDQGVDPHDTCHHGVPGACVECKSERLEHEMSEQLEVANNLQEIIKRLLRHAPEDALHEEQAKEYAKPKPDMCVIDDINDEFMRRNKPVETRDVCYCGESMNSYFGHDGHTPTRMEAPAEVSHDPLDSQPCPECDGTGWNCDRCGATGSIA